MAEPPLNALAPGSILLAGRAYHTNAVRALTDEKKAWGNIPPTRNRTETFAFSSSVNQQRNLVQRFFNKVKNFRGIATRCDKNTLNLLAGIKIAAIRIWIECL